MALDPNSTLGQTDAIYIALSDFFHRMSESAESGGSLPKISDIAEQLIVDQVQTYAKQSQNKSASYAIGCAVEVVHLSAAIFRDYALSTKSKSEFYGDASEEALAEEQYYLSQGGLYSAILQGQASPR